MMIKRRAVQAMALSGAALVGLLTQEGYSEKAERPLFDDVPTVGFGTTTHTDGSPVKLGEAIDPVQAVARAARDVERIEKGIKGCLSVPLHQHEYDAIVHFGYNIGTGAFCTSTLVKKLNALDYPGACAEMSRWVFQNKRDCRLDENNCAGLPKRRAVERGVCDGSLPVSALIKVGDW